MFLGGRPLKRWRYVGVFGPQLMLCAAHVRVGPGHQSFWAAWDGAVLHGRTRTFGGHGRVQLSSAGELRIDEADFAAHVHWREGDGVETISRHGKGGVIWTRKQAGALAHGEVRFEHQQRGGVQLEEAQVVVDDSAGYHARETAWLWCAGVGRSTGGAQLGWNLVSGLHDSQRHSERTLWVDGKSRELAPADFAPDLSRVGELRFEQQAVRSRRERFGPLVSDYQQPFGRFSGSVGGVELAQGFGVMERHFARW